MSTPFWLTGEQVERLRPFFPKSHKKPRVDDRRVLSGILFISRNGSRWCDAPKEYGPPKTLYNRWKRWGDKGIFASLMEGLASKGTGQKTIMSDATYLKADPLPGSTCKACASGAQPPDCGRRRGAIGPKEPPDRPNQGRHENQTARRYRCGRPPVARLHDRRPGQRPYRGSCPAGRFAKGGVAAGRPALRCRLIHRCVEKQGDKTLHPGPEVARQAHQARQAPLQTTQQDRNHVRAAEGPEARRHPLRPMPESLPLRRRSGSNRHVLALKRERVLTLENFNSLIGNRSEWSQLFRRDARRCRRSIPS